MKLRLPAALALIAALGAAWPLYRADLDNSGRAAGPAQVRHVRLSALWSYRSDGWITSTPAIRNGLVYVGTWHGEVLALDARTGRPRWRRRLPVNADALYGETRGVVASIALAGASAYAVSGGCEAAAFDARTGALRWQRRICSTARNDDTYASPVVAAGVVLVGIDLLGDRPTDRGALLALDARTGALRWRFDPVQYAGMGSGISATPAVDLRRSVAFVGTGNPLPRGNPPAGPDPLSDSILALRLRDGALLWSFGPVHPHDAEDRDMFASPNRFAATRGRRRLELIGEGGKDGVYYAIDARDGREVWQTQLAGDAPFAMQIGTAAVARGTVFVPLFENARTGWLIALQARDGSIAWRDRLDGAYEAPCVWGDVVFETLATGRLVALDARDGKRLGGWTIGRRAFGRGPSIAGSTLYAAALDRLSAWRVRSTP